MQKGNEILQFDRLHSNEVRLLLDSLKVAVEQVSPTLGPHGPVKLAKSLALLQRALGESFEAYLDSIKDSADPENLADTARRVFVGYLRFLHENYLGSLLPADPHSFPVELLHPMKDMLIKFGGYTKEQTSFGLLQWDQYNFRVAGFNNPLLKITEELKSDVQIECSKKIKKEISSLPEYFVFITYPQAEGRNVFLQGLLFHELAHAIDWKKGISKAIISAITWPEASSSSGVPDVFKNWVKEIVADLVATRLWGPCALLSCRLTSLTVDVMDKDLLSHPASRFRMWWMLQHLKRMGYMGGELGPNTMKILREWDENFKDVEPASVTVPQSKTVRSVLKVKEIAEALHSSVEKGFGGKGFPADTFIKQVPAVVANFRDHLPHCGQGIDPASHMASVFVSSRFIGGRDPAFHRRTGCECGSCGSCESPGRRI